MQADRRDAANETVSDEVGVSDRLLRLVGGEQGLSQKKETEEKENWLCHYYCMFS